MSDNLADHMFREQERASNALQNLTGRASEGFSPVTGFCEATWIYEENVCNRGGYCNWQLTMDIYLSIYFHSCLKEKNFLGHFHLLIASSVLDCVLHCMTGLNVFHSYFFLTGFLQSKLKRFP